MTVDEVERLCERITTWDQDEIDRLLGQPAVDYAEAHERDVRRLASEMRAVFPFGPKWWKIRTALLRVESKNDAIRERARQIAEGRRVGWIVERDGRLMSLRK